MSSSSKKKLRKEQQAMQMTEKQQQANKEAKKLKIYTIAFVLVMAIVVAVFVGNILYKSLDIPGVVARHDTVLEVNDHDVSAVELSYFYIDAISNQYNSWYNDYGDYTAMMLAYMYGLDVSSPLNKSYYDTDKTVTWADMFANQAIADATEVYTLYDAAKAAGHKLSDEEKANVDAIIHNIEHVAKDNGFKSMGDYLVAMYGTGANKDTYRSYLTASALANSYRTAYADSLTFTDAEREANLAENPNDYSTFSYTSYLLKAEDFYQGGTKAEGSDTITYSEEEKSAGRADCKMAADSILIAKPKNAAELNKAIANLKIYKNKTDENGKTVAPPTATPNSDVTYNYISSTYRDWVTDSTRKTGDFTIIPVTSSITNEDGTKSDITTGYYALIFDGRNDYEENTVTVRHILIGFEGGTKVDGVTTYSDAEKLEAKTKAEEVLAQFNATGKTPDDFAALVEANSTDPGSKYNGGLYSHILPGQMVENFDNWIFDESRKSGDCEIVETEYGYHLIYFVEADELNYRDYMIDSTLRNEAVNTWLDTLVDGAKIGEKDISTLELDFVISPYSYN